GGVERGGGGGGRGGGEWGGGRRATVIGTAAAAKHDALRSFGVEYPIDYRHANVEDEVKRITRGRGADVIMDPLGGGSFGASYRMLAPLGRLGMLGEVSMARERRAAWLVR